MFCQTMVEKLSDVFFKILLPELITRKHDPKNRSEKQHCSCQRPSFPPMITCNGKSCKFQYFHYSCVGLKNAPRAQWYCMDCKGIEEKSEKFTYTTKTIMYCHFFTTLGLMCTIAVMMTIT